MTISPPDVILHASCECGLHCPGVVFTLPIIPIIAERLALASVARPAHSRWRPGLRADSRLIVYSKSACTPLETEIVGRTREEQRTNRQ